MFFLRIRRKIFISFFVALFLALSIVPASAGFLSSKPEQEFTISQNSQKKIDAFNERAVQFFEEGRFKEAQEHWEKAIQVMERSGKYATENKKWQDVLKFDDEELVLPGEGEVLGVDDVDDLYEMAVSLFKKQKYVTSKKIFDRVEAVVPDYRASRNYLTILNHKIKRAQQVLGGEKVKEKAVARREERAEWKRILMESEKEMRRKLIEQAEPLYAEALEHYKSREFRLAKDYFLETNSVLSEYKDTEKYLKRINGDILKEEKRLVREKRKKRILVRKKEKDEWQRILDESQRELQRRLAQQVGPIYREAVYNYRKRQFELAKSHFQEVETILPSYKSTAQYLGRIDQDIEEEAQLAQQQRARDLQRQQREEELVGVREEARLEKLRGAREKERLRGFRAEMNARKKEREEWLKVIEETEGQRRKRTKDQAEFVYQEATRFYKSRQFSQAKEDFREVERILPGYKSTAKYLDRIDRDIEKLEKERLEEQERAFQRRMREKQLAERRKMEEEKQAHAIEERERLREFKGEALARKKQREEWDRVTRENENERQKRLEEEAEFVYGEAVGFYKAKQWEQAKNRFLETEKILPGYKTTGKYLANIDRDMQKDEEQRQKRIESISELQRREDVLAKKQEEKRRQKKLVQKKETQARAFYVEALSHYKSREFKLARDYFFEIEDVLPGYKDTGKYLERIDSDILKEEKRLMEEKRKKGILTRKREKEEWQRILDESQRELQKKLEKQAEPIYRKAIHSYKKRQFESAKSYFQEVESILPSYKSTAQYFERINDDIAEEGRLAQRQRVRDLEMWRREAELAKERKENERLKRFQAEIAERKKEREEWLEVIEEAEQRRREKIKEQTGFVYQEAIRFYKNGQLARAKENFKEVERILPGFKATVKYLARIDKDIKRQERRRLTEQEQVFQKEMLEKQLAERRKMDEERKLHVIEERKRLREFKEEALARKKQREEWSRIALENENKRKIKLEEEAEFIYKEALKFYEAKRWEQARIRFLEVEGVFPGYKLTGKYLTNIDRDMQRDEERRREMAGDVLELQKREDTLAKKQEEKWRQREQKAAAKEQIQQREMQAEAIYKFARSLYSRGKYSQAKEKFLGVAEIFPGYKATDKYLKRIDGGIAKDQKRRQKEQQLAFKRQTKERRLEQEREEEQLDRLRRAEEVRRLASLREEALLRQEEREEWEKTVRQIEGEHLKRLQQQTVSIYQEALRYHNAGWFEQARETFKEVEAMRPGYKSTAKYLKRIDSDIRKDNQLRQESKEEIWQRQQREEELAKQSRDVQEGQLRKIEDRKRLERLKKEAAVRQQEKERLKKSFERIEKKHRDRLQKQAEEIYRVALGHYKAGLFEKAKMAFIDVERILPEYKSTDKYLARLNDGAEQKKEYRGGGGDVVTQKTVRKRRKESLSEAKGKYREARDLYKAREFISAKLKFIEVESLSPGYKDTLDYLSRIDEDINQNRQLATRDGAERDIRSEVEEIFRQGVVFYKAKKFDRARARFLEVEYLDPEHKAMKRYLKRVDKKIAARQKRLKHKEPAEPKKEIRLEEDKIRQEADRRNDMIQRALSQAVRGLKEKEQKSSAPQYKKQKEKREKSSQKHYVQDRRKELKRQRQKVRKEYEKEFQRLYSRAVKLYRSGSYGEAKGMFLQIERMRPGYKKTASYLKKVEAKIRNSSQKKKKNATLQQQEAKTRGSIIDEVLDTLE